MFKVEKHVWRTVSGQMVGTGHPDAAVLVYAAGDQIPDDEAERVGLKAKPAHADKAAPKPQDKAVAADADKDADLDSLRAVAEKAGVKVDNRWGSDRLRQEIEAATPKPKGKS